MQLRPIRLGDEGDLAETGLACRRHEIREYLVTRVRVGTQVQFRRRRLQRRGVETCLDGGEIDGLALPEQRALAVDGDLDLVCLGLLHGGGRLRQIDLVCVCVLWCGVFVVFVLVFFFFVLWVFFVFG